MASLSVKYEDRRNSDKYGRGNKCNSLNSPVILKKFSRSQKLRAEALGWDGWMKEPFETNQSLLSNFQFFVPDSQDKMEDSSGNKLNFTPIEHDQICNKSPNYLTVKEPSLNDNFVKSVPNLSSSALLETNSSYFSTRKAIFTISLPSSQILVVNFAACQLLNYRSNELCSMKLENLVYDSYQDKWIKLKKNFFKDSSNPYSNGKLIELVQNNGSTIVVSLYLKKLNNPQKCLVIAEPLDQKAAVITIDHNGKILSYDEETCFLFQYDASELIGVHICTLLPAIHFNDYSEHHCRETFKQYITGKTKNQSNFPVCLTVNYSNSGSEIFQVVIWVYLNLSGLFFVNKDLLLTNCNHYFIKLLFGYSKKEVINQSIVKIIPSFGKDIRLDKLKSDHDQKKLQTISNEEVHNILWGRDDSFQEICDGNDFKTNSMTLRSKVDSSSEELIIQNNSTAKPLFLQNMEDKIENNHKNDNEIVEGKYFGFGQHKDGTLIDIKYQIKSTTLTEELQYYVYLYRDLQRFEKIRNTMSTPMASTFNSTSFDSSLPDENIENEYQTRPSPASIISQCDEILTAGEYCKYYTNIRQIGKGTFGYVKMAFRNSDGLLVVTKFIKKQKINIRSWVYHPNLNMKIPLEINLLITLQHPNIVKVIDVFHNDSFVQLVMEKHGAGFDLFEFIDRGPNCDEKLKSYIFRQIVSAVHYLDSLGILHRDIKDENVIIDEKFQVKLIDFGSAAFMPPNETFSKFYGTMEYCSPEVLLGNNYRGPELEIWSLGVTLYVLTFGENPFYNVEETVKGKFSIPVPISKELNDLLHKMLDKNIETRITIKKLAENEWINQPVCIENYKFEEVVRCYEDEAYPPKYVSEIHVEEFFSRRNSQTDSEKIFDKTNSSNSLQNVTMDELFDADDNHESFKSAKIDSAQQRKNISPVMLFSTPLQKKNFRLSKSAVALRKRLENSLSPKDCHYVRAVENLLENEVSLNNTKLKHFNKSSPNLLESEISKKSENSLDSANFELEIRFKRCYFEGEKDEENLVDNQSKYSIVQDEYLEDSEETSDEQLVEEIEHISQCFNPN